MNATELTERLMQAKHSADFQSVAESIVQEIPPQSSDLELVRALLSFMEQNPSLDYGLPGPLVHFVERFYRRGYERELLSSITRRPTPHTIWMLNRVINGTHRLDERDRLVGVLAATRNHALSDEQTRELIEQFLRAHENET